MNRISITAFISLLTLTLSAHSAPRHKKENVMPQAFVYTELQASVPFDKAPWRAINKDLLRQPGLLNKTWLAGVGNHSVGGIYAFDTLAHAQQFVTGYFPKEAAKLGAAQTTRVFDASVVEVASRAMGSVHFGGVLPKSAGAFVYTEVQVSVPFETVPWPARNTALKKTPGLLAKTWLSGVNTHTVGGLYAFDSVENARHFVLELFPKAAAAQNAAFYTRVFDAKVVREASQMMGSPFFSSVE